MRGYGKTEISAAVRDAGGAIFAVTSEPQTLAGEAHAMWNTDFPHVGDPHHEIANDVRERGWLSLFVNPEIETLADASGFASHPNGYFQPGVLCVSNQGRVLYRWRGRPTRKNMGGATERPLAEDVWEKIEAAIAAGSAAGDAEMDVPKRYDMNGIPWPFFVSLLVANGNFLRARPFPIKRNGEDGSRRFPAAIGKLVAAAVGLGAAAAFVPTYLVLGVCLAYAAWITPSVRTINRNFQNVPTGEA